MGIREVAGKAVGDFGAARRVATGMRLVVLAFFVVGSLGPLIWLFMSSVKSTGEIIASPWSLPRSLDFENYAQAWTLGRIGHDLLNSVVVAVLSLAIMVGSGSLAAYAIDKYTRVKARWPMLMFFLLGQMIPGQVVIIPVYIIVSKLHLLNSYLGLSLVYSASGLPFVIFIMQGFFQSVPRELYDAASVDGFGEFLIFRKVALPLARPAVMAALIIQFLFVWNEFILATVLDGSGNYVTLPVGLYDAVIGPFTTSYGTAFAGVCLAVIPIIIVYAVLQRWIIRGITVGALKG